MMNAALSELSRKIRSGIRNRKPAAAPQRRQAFLAALPPGRPIPLPARLKDQLRGVITRQLTVNLLECAAALAAVVSSLLLLQALADWSFDLPWFVRFLFLTGDIGVVLVLGYVFAWLPWKRRLTIETAALRVEAEIPEFGSGLISAVELAAARPGCTQGSLELVHQLISRVDALAQKHHLAARVVKTVELRRWAGRAVVVVIVTAVSAFLTWPKSLVLMERILLSHAPLPTRTVVVPITKDEVVSLGGDITLSASARGVIPKFGKVIVDGANGERVEYPVNARLEEPGVFKAVLKNVQQGFQYHFVLNDGVGPDFKVTAHAPPTLHDLKIHQAYPAYTGLGRVEMPPGNLVFLAGSRIQIEAKASQPLGTVTIRLAGVNREVPMKIDGQDKDAVSGEFQVPVEGLTGLSLAAVDSKGAVSVNDTLYQVEVTPDQPPTVDILAPKADKITILQTSKPRITFSAKDDFEIKSLVLKYELSWPVPIGRTDAPPATSGKIPLDVPAGTSFLQKEYVWDVPAQTPPWTEACSVTYWIEATDNNDVTGPGITDSEKKTLEVVSPEEKKRELLQILNETTTNIQGISNTQEQINQSLDSDIRKSQP